MGGSRFNDQEYVNWLRATLALTHMKESLEHFTYNQAIRFHNTLVASLGPHIQACTGPCSSTDIKKDTHNQRWHMTCQTCNLWLQRVISFHRNAIFPNLSPENTDPFLWQTDPWETMKVYMSHGCVKDQSAKDADIQGSLSLFINCKHFSTGSHIGRQDLLDKLMDIRNTLLHSSNLKVDDTVVEGHFKMITEFLQGMKSLTSIEKKQVKEAIENIDKLRTNVIEISMNKELELRALQQRQIALDRDLRSLVDGIQKDQDTLKAGQETFDEFLKQNDLVDDMTKLSKQMTDIDKRVHTLEVRMKVRTTKEEFQENHSVVDIGHVSKQVAAIDKRVQILEETIKTKPDSSVKDLETQCKELQAYLIHLYEEQIYWTDPMASVKTSLLEMYTKPLVNRFRIKDEHGILADEPCHSKLTYDSMFMTNTRMCEHIYIFGEAGSGKTTFCNKIILDWCRAVQDILTPDLTLAEQKVLSYFKLLFYISLDNFETLYNIEEMIQGQLGPDLNISELLKSERCLIILDGLDEWKCHERVKQLPDKHKHIPNKGIANKKCTFITATSNWKCNTIALDNNEYDKHVQLGGIDYMGSWEFVEKLKRHLAKLSQKRKATSDVMINRSSQFRTDPGNLIQLLTLWSAGRDFGTSQTQLFCSALDFLFERSQKKYPTQNAKCSSVEKQIKLPDHFSAMEFCQKKAELLCCLTKLGYETLFNKQREERFAFKSSKLEAVCISPSDIELCLQCDILFQRKDNDMFSFVQKRIQQCLAASFLVTHGETGVISEVKEICYSLEIMLEMNQVWLFVAGMNPGITKQLLEHLASVASADKHVKEYRKTVICSLYVNDSYLGSGNVRELYRLMEIQRCVYACLSEGIANGLQYKDICLEDLLIDKYSFGDIVILLPCTDMIKVKSLCICIGNFIADMDTWVDKLEQCRSLQKLTIRDPWSFVSSMTVTTLVDNNCNSLTSLCFDTRITAPDQLVTTLCTSISKCLIALQLTGVKLTHAHRDKILNSLSQSQTLRQLNLSGICCKNHGKDCKPRVDFSATQLRELVLGFMCQVNLLALPHSLAKVRLTSITVTSLCDYALRLTKTKSEVTVKLFGVTFTDLKQDSEDVGGILGTCPTMQLTRFEYSHSTWDIEFNTNSQ